MRSTKLNKLRRRKEMNNKVKLMLRCSSVSAEAIALFWFMWYLISDSMPVVSHTQLWLVTGQVFNLPFGMSRFWDVFLGPLGSVILVWMLSFDYRKTKISSDLMIAGMFVGLVFGLLSELVFGPIIGINFGLGCGLIFGLIAGFGRGVAPEKLVGLALGLGFGVGFGLIFGLVTGLVAGLIAGPTVGLAFGLADGLIVGLDKAIPFFSGDVQKIKSNGLLAR